MSLSWKLALVICLCVTSAIDVHRAIGQTPAKSNPRQPFFNTETKQRGYAPVNGLQLYYEVHGAEHDGIPLVLIHGGGSTIESNWSRMIPLLAKSRKVIAFEEQGHGHTKSIDRPFTFENSASDLAALLDVLNVETADVLGFSNGGNIALQFGRLHPTKVNRLVVISAMYRRDGMIAGFWNMFTNPDISMMPEALKAADRKINPDPQHLQQLFEQDSTRMASFKDWPDEYITGIKAPTLVVVGDQDVVLPEHALRMSRLLPAGRLLVVPGKHGDFLGDVLSDRLDSQVPTAIATMIEDFLDR
ncbi:alpha/beta hydrolase [Stieleria sp. JC731]|uniref:alpha/beta fold hydrolase n=1 Tax=Pirellulaceae TaxID=2691357 RepID=UPI001E354BDF|nr:alpha/beta hydrolase [Stieleria sp. JC731]MCC9600955.1 alpha/beta hydrolase [Stieleria sp. JC731]